MSCKAINADNGIFRGPLRDFACIDALLRLRQATSSAGGFDFVLLDRIHSSIFFLYIWVVYAIRIEINEIYLYTINRHKFS